jgi:cation transport ATPase
MARLLATVEPAAVRMESRAAASDALAREGEAREREYRSLMRTWWFGAAVGSFTMVLSYPWLFPVLGDWFPRGSPQLWWIWAGMGVASLAVLAYSGNQFFRGAWQALRHRSANMHTLIAMGTGIAWIYSTVALLSPQLFPAAEYREVYYDVAVVVTALVVLGLAMELRAKGRTSDITLIKGSLRGVVLAIQISRATMRNVYQNLFGAFVYNTLGLPIALGALYPVLGILLSPLLAALAMSFSSVTVVANANRLKRWTPKAMPGRAEA